MGIGLAKYNVKFGEHKLAQDLDILRLKREKIAVFLVGNFKNNGWAETPAAKSVEVRKIIDGINNKTVISSDFSV